MANNDCRYKLSLTKLENYNIAKSEDYCLSLTTILLIDHAHLLTPFIVKPPLTIKLVYERF